MQSFRQSMHRFNMSIYGQVCSLGSIITCPGSNLDPICPLKTNLTHYLGYLLPCSRDMAEIPLKRRKSSIQPTNQPSSILSFFYDLCHFFH